MLKHLTDLITKLSILPLSDESFITTDVFSELIERCCTEEQFHYEYKVYDNFVEMMLNSYMGSYWVDNKDTIELLISQYFPLTLFKNRRNLNEVYLKHLSDLAKSFICHRNGNIALKYWENKTYERMFGAFDDYNKIELWNSFSRQFCIDLLVVIYLINNGMKDEMYLDGYYWLINIGDLQLDQVLNKGLAETHIHINAGINFPCIWEELMSLDKIDISTNEIINQRGKDQFGGYVTQAAVSRVLMAIFLKYKEDVNENITFGKYLFELKENKMNISFSKEYIEAVEIVTTLLRGEKVKYTDYDSRKIFATLTNGYHSIMELFHQDVDTTDENVFLFKCIKYLKAREDDVDFGKAFWRYITIKNIFYQSVTQNNYREGLKFFVDYYERSTYTQRYEREHLTYAIKNQIHNNQLKKLELRMNSGLSSHKKQIEIKIHRKLKMFFEIYMDLLKRDLVKEQIPQMGIVFHLIKSSDSLKFEKCWYNSEGTFEINHAYGQLQQQYMYTVEIINHLRETIPKLSYYIVGLDAAAIENDSEPWVFAPIYAMARDSNTHRYNYESRYVEKINNLGFTFHVGEEFRHLFSGLRHIDEVIEHFGYHAGDRIGHGIALGISVEEWIHNHPIVILTRGEYMEDLLWIWGLGYQELIDTSIMNVMSVEREIMEQAMHIYQNLEGITIYNLWLAYQNKFNPFFSNIDFKDKEDTENNNVEQRREIQELQIFCCKAKRDYNLSWNAQKLTHAYHCKCYIERAQEVIQIKVNKEQRTVMEHLQTIVRVKLNKRGIVVETNPSSNLAISGIERLFKHYIISLNSKGLDGKFVADKGLIITINSDDPVVFNTTISNEFAYIFYLLQEKGYSRDSILEWIDKVRGWGIDTSFIPTRTLGKCMQIKEIEEILMALK
ncbi:MAG: hypothetical protein K0S71_44 [Clostridia bacterium]|jgi:adenosine deaminase|nr:hypothetical protein [Clostridia bacterium]